MSHRARTCSDRRRSALAGWYRALAVALPLAVVAAAARAEAAPAIFQIDDTPGEIHLSDRADAAAGVIVRRIAGLPLERPRATTAATPLRFADLVHSAAAAQRLSPALLDAVIAVESGYQVRAVSARGASGLMQLMPATARLYGVTDLFDPAQNIGAGARHLRGLLDRYGQDVARALAAYNAGAGAVDRAAQQRRAWPAETTAYVPNVLGRVAAHGSPATP